MKYYKLLLPNEFIGITTSFEFVQVNPNNGWLLTSDENQGQFISYNNQLYRDFWMQPIPNNTLNYTRVDVQEITQEEYQILYEAIHSGDEIPIPDDDNDEEEEPIVPPQDNEPDLILEFTRESKLRAMRHECQSIIENGFDLRGHHYSLTEQDQLNLMSLQLMAQTENKIPYHADGEEVKYYSVAEILEIINAANQLKLYHTTYYNSLKAYINSLETIEDIAAVTYGMEIPEEFQTDVLKVLM